MAGGCIHPAAGRVGQASVGSDHVRPVRRSGRDKVGRTACADAEDDSTRLAWSGRPSAADGAGSPDLLPTSAVDGDFENVDGQLGARPQGPGELHLLLNRGSEVFRVGGQGVELVWRRVASDAEDAALDRAAAVTVEQLRGRGVEARIVSQRLNRRKIDLIPTAEWGMPQRHRPLTTAWRDVP